VIVSTERTFPPATMLLYEQAVKKGMDHSVHIPFTSFGFVFQNDFIGHLCSATTELPSTWLMSSGMWHCMYCVNSYEHFGGTYLTPLRQKQQACQNVNNLTHCTVSCPRTWKHLQFLSSLELAFYSIKKSSVNNIYRFMDDVLICLFSYILNNKINNLNFGILIFGDTVKIGKNKKMNTVNVLEKVHKMHTKVCSLHSNILYLKQCRHYHINICFYWCYMFRPLF
jgi:hypothetical protein